MEITKLYIDLNNCLIDLQNNQKHQNAQASRCDDYYNCVHRNAHLVGQYKKLEPEIARNFVRQQFDVNTLSSDFKRLESIDVKLRDLQRTMPEIRKYMKTEAENIELGIQPFADNLNFERMDETEDWIDGIIYELERIKQERKDNIERWKSAGITILKYAGIVIVFFFTFLWRMINSGNNDSNNKNNKNN